MGRIVPIQVTSATPLDETTRNKIENAFKKKHGGESVAFEYHTNPDILGGLLINDNDYYYDATIRGQLSKIRHIL